MRRVQTEFAHPQSVLMGRYRHPTNGTRLEVHRVENSEGVDMGHVM